VLKALPARQGFELEYLKNFAENKIKKKQE
jgi:hypothetical protein